MNEEEVKKLREPYKIKTCTSDLKMVQKLILELEEKHFQDYHIEETEEDGKIYREIVIELKPIIAED